MNFHALQKHAFYTHNGVRVKYIYPTINHFVFVDEAGNEYKLSTVEVEQLIFEMIKIYDNEKKLSF